MAKHRAFIVNQGGMYYAPRAHGVVSGEHITFELTGTAEKPSLLPNLDLFDVSRHRH